MNCICCKGTMEKGLAPFHTDRKGDHITLDRAPAWVCTQCGEVYFDEPAVEAIQEVLCTLDQGTEKMAKSA
ncbi:MAG: YgiT-type zinc finger protein [Chlorobiaceae bacterium]|nr:YgiT-type zinc finger protein [Chlorobiaceae bacterium]